MTHAKALLSLLIVGFVFQSTTAALAQTATVEVTIQAVKPEAKEITVTYKTSLGEKPITLDVSRKAEITLNGEVATLESLGSGQKGTIEYNRELAIVTKIDATGYVTGWTFVDMHGGKCDPETACTVKDGILICSTEGGYCLASNQAFDAVIFKVEFRYPTSDKISKFGGSIVVAGIEPDLNSSNWPEKLPRGFELCLAPGRCGEVLLPSMKDYPTDQVALPLGQLRDGRRITRLREKELPVGQWNKLETEWAVNGNFTIKLNGELVNGMQNAKAVGRKIFLWPMGSEIHFRSPTVVVNGDEETLEFIISK